MGMSSDETEGTNRNLTETPSSAITPLIKMEGMNRSYGPRGSIQANKDISLSISPGQFISVLGPNGAGKTTLFRILCRLIDPDNPSTVTFDPSLRPYGDIAYIPSDAGHFMRMKVKESLAFFAQLVQIPRKRQKQEIARVVEAFGLKPYLNRPLSKLSKGWQQRVHLAHALLEVPKLLIADEPFNGLDLLSRQSFTQSLAQLSDEGVAVLVSSHTPDYLTDVVDRLWIIHDGRMLCDEPLHGETLSERYTELVLAAEKSSNSSNHKDSIIEQESAK